MSGRPEEPDPELAGVCERLEIFDVFNLYGEALDDKRWTLLDDVFTHDVTATWSGERERRGRAEVVSFVRRLMERVAKSHHLFGNYTAAVFGATAEASVRMRGYFRGSGAAELFVDTIGSLSGELVLTTDGWRFRRLDHELLVVGGTSELFPSELPAAERPAQNP